jgi:crotonobetainyl-CoA:carnitine CoA-transferase CaiB-like acyl-CoA transferase
VADDKVHETGSFLTGVRVIELADELGEYCGKVLAGLGADVIKIEQLGGEKTRRYGPFYNDEPHPNRSLHFWHYNFGKRSVVIDLDSDEGVRQFMNWPGRPTSLSIPAPAITWTGDASATKRFSNTIRP